jgi:hypothetical protein
MHIHLIYRNSRAFIISYFGKPLFHTSNGYAALHAPSTSVAARAPEAASSHLLQLRIGRQRASEMFLLGKCLDLYDSEEIDRLVHDAAK